MFLMVGRDRVELELNALVVAGFTGRDEAEVRRHVDELASEGIPGPEMVPAFYVLPPEAITQADSIEVEHAETSGEAEIAVLISGARRLVTLASDHTDRLAETTSIALGKRSCPKVLARSAWDLADVEGHWDDLQLRSWIVEKGARSLYQEGAAATLRPYEDLFTRLPTGVDKSDYALLCGTVAARGGIRGADRFEAELYDPHLDRSIRLGYGIGRD